MSPVGFNPSPKGAYKDLCDLAKRHGHTVHLTVTKNLVFEQKGQERRALNRLIVKRPDKSILMEVKIDGDVDAAARLVLPHMPKEQKA